jgi:hypothetical protein
MDATGFLQDIKTRTQIQVIGIAQNDICVDVVLVQQEIAMHPFNGSCCTNRHKNGGLDPTVCGINDTGPCLREGIFML